MGKSDLDDVLKDLGDPSPDAPREPGDDVMSPSPHQSWPNSPSPQPAPDTAQPDDPGGARSSIGSNQHAALSDLYTPDAAHATDEGDFCQTLLEQGVVSGELVASAQRVVKQTPGKRLAQVLIEMGADETAVQERVAKDSRLPFERIDRESDEAFDYKSLQKLTLEFCKSNNLLPLRREGTRLVVGTMSPDDVFLLDDVKRRLGVASIKHVLVTSADVQAVVDRLTEHESDDYDVDDILADVGEDDVELIEEEATDADVEDAESSPVVRYVNHIIQTALKEGASDIHIEPEERTLKVRFRIDGLLFEMMNPPRKMHAAITSRLKIMANLDIAERRLPQDGRIRVTVLGRKIDLRVSTVPTPKGEKTVMRILDTRAINVSLEDLGFSDDTYQLWKKQIDQPHGIILVTGPTGSGKTTTLYSSIRQMDLQKLNISTVEDPIEYNLVGITQIQTHEMIGLTFSGSLRALLRQDPDVVMVGEIRDSETATIAIQAALTGHLVLSTLHTNDAPASVTRLINIGVEPFLVGAAVNAVLAQRLARRICPNCTVEDDLPEDMMEVLSLHGEQMTTVYRGKGCSRCRETGYQGRVGLYELLVLDDFLRDKIAAEPNVIEFRRMCCDRGMVSLRQDGFSKVAQGQTTVEEILRVTQATA